MSLYKPANEIFKKRGGKGPHNCCVYRWRFINNPYGPRYDGEGNSERPNSHNSDLLSRTKRTEPMELCLLADGLTKFEAQIYEAELIREGDVEFGLSKRGATEWDGHSMLNKQREISMEQYIDEYLW